MKTRKLYVITFLAVTGVAAACGGKGDESIGGDGDGDVSDGDVGDGDVGDGDVGDGDVGDGDVGDGDGGPPMGGATGMGGALGTGGAVVGTGGNLMGTGGDIGAGGVPSMNGGCSGSALSCEAQSQDACIVAGCSIAPGCSGEAGCEELETAMLCNSGTDALECRYGTVCSGTPNDCADRVDSVSCESVGCTWTEN